MLKLSSLFRLDGWKNIFSGIGTNRDKSTITENVVPGFPRLIDIQLQGLYYSDGRIQNVVDIPAEKMVQNGFEVEGDDGTLYKAYDDLGGPAAFAEAIRWTRMLGGAVIVLDVEGAGDWAQPWYPGKGAGKIRSLRVYPRSRVELGLMETVSMPESVYFENYERYIIRTAMGGTFTVHASRVLVFKSTTRVDMEFPGWLDYERFWGLSTIYKGLEDAHNFGLTSKGTAHLTQECSIGKYRLTNLEQLVAEGDWKSLDDRMTAIDMQKSIIHGVMLGEGEEYTRENFSFTGLPEVWDRQMMAVAGSYRIPVTLLFGRSAAGMNATGEGDEDNFNTYIAGLQKVQLLPPLLKFMTMLNMELGIVKTEGDQKLTIDFLPLSKRDQLKDAQVKEAISRADRNYVESGILSPDDIIRNRFLGGYNTETSVDESALVNLPAGEGEA